MRPIDADALKKALESYRYAVCGFEGVLALIDAAETLPQVTVFTEDTDEKAVEDLKAELQSVIDARPEGECKTCVHRDPEDKKCDCGALERQGCQFPVSDDYFCKYYKKGGTE